MKRFVYIVIIGFLSACNPIEQPIIEPTPFLCLGFVLDQPIFCNSLDATDAIFQSNPDNPVILRDGTLTITIRGASQLRRLSDNLIITVLEGSAVVSAMERTRVLLVQQRLELEIVDGEVQAPEANAVSLDSSELTAIAIKQLPVATATIVITEETLALSSLDEAVTLAETEVVARTPTATRAIIDRDTDEETCEPDSLWEETYTVKSGDVLSFIARDFGTTVLEMVAANCLTNPELLRIGQSLRVPQARPTATPTSTATVNPNTSTIAFRADVTTLTSGECTTLRWDAFDAIQILLDAVLISDVNMLSVCPVATTTYILSVVYPDGREATRELTLTILQP